MQPSSIVAPRVIRRFHPHAEAAHNLLRIAYRRFRPGSSNLTMRVGIALGSNIGRRLIHLQEARDVLAKYAVPGSEILQSSVYQTAPVDCPANSPDFYNAVIEIEFAGTPPRLLAITQEIEQQFGRLPQTTRNAPRIIDLDLLYFGDQIVSSDKLEVPHPRLTQRRFVLQPLFDIRPDLILPGDQLTIREHLQLLDRDEPPLSLVQSHW